MKKTIALLLIVMLFAFPCFADILVMQDGNKIKGTIMDQDEKSVTIRIIETGNELTVKKSDIAAIVLGDFDKKLVEKMISENTAPLWGMFGIIVGYTIYSIVRGR